jgi:5'-nucleotidase
LPVLNERLSELSKSVQVINSNVRNNVPEKAHWIQTVTSPYSIIHSPCKKVRVALFGLLSDEPGVFRDNTFRGIPVDNVLDTYSEYHRQLYPKLADFCIPLTHASMQRDRELAKHMLTLNAGPGLIIGGHEHEPYNELVEGDELNSGSVRILKSGVDAQAVSLIDLYFETTDERPQLVEIQADLVEMSSFEPSVVVQTIVDKHMSVIKALEHEDIVDNSTSTLPPGVALSSERTRFQQTTVGGVFCQMIKEELEVDAALVNGASIKGGKIYEHDKMSYAELKKELPFPTKMVIVSMERWQLEEAIRYSRNNMEEGTDRDAEEVPRRGYIQVDVDYDQNGERNGSHDDLLQVALPRNLLNGFCDIKPLMEVGAQLKAEGTFPGDDDFFPVIDLIVRHSCKNRWLQIVNEFSSFDDLDLNKDGVLDRHEVKQMMAQVLGHEPSDFVVDDMISSIDSDENGVIDAGEFSYLLATMERELGQKQY